MLIKYFLSVGLLLLCVMEASFAAGEAGYKVIVNSSNSVSSVDKQFISKVFLKKTIKWADGRMILAVDQAAGSPVRTEFSQAVHNRSVSAIKNYWQQQAFAGREIQPQEKDSDNQVIEFVKANSGAIGYVSGSAVVTGVKVLKITD